MSNISVIACQNQLIVQCGSGLRHSDAKAYCEKALKSKYGYLPLIYEAGRNLVRDLIKAHGKTNVCNKFYLHKPKPKDINIPKEIPILLLIAAGAVAMLDSPAPGPADAVAVGLLGMFGYEL